MTSSETNGYPSAHRSWLTLGPGPQDHAPLAYSMPLYGAHGTRRSRRTSNLTRRVFAPEVRYGGVQLPWEAGALSSASPDERLSMRIIEDQMALIEPESSASFYETMLQVGPRETRSLKQVFPDQNSPGLPEEISLQQSLASAVVRLVAEEGVSRSIFQWITLADTPHAQDLLGIGRTANPPLVPLSESFLSSIGEDGLLGDAYCAVVPPDLRHRLGEHYTPPWLVERIASLAEPRELVCDPACGDGRFLVTLARNGHALDSLFGVELNPLAVMFARWNMWRDRKSVV